MLLCKIVLTRMGALMGAPQYFYTKERIPRARRHIFKISFSTRRREILIVFMKHKIFHLQSIEKGQNEKKKEKSKLCFLWPFFKIRFLCLTRFASFCFLFMCPQQQRKSNSLDEKNEINVTTL